MHEPDERVVKRGAPPPHWCIRTLLQLLVDLNKMYEFT